MKSNLQQIVQLLDLHILLARFLTGELTASSGAVGLSVTAVKCSAVQPSKAASTVPSSR